MYKFWWSRSEEGRNGVCIVVKEDLVEEVIEVKRLDDKMMKIAIMVYGRILCVFSVYAPQQSRPDEEKREFVEKLSDNIHDVPQEDLSVVAGDQYVMVLRCDRMFQFWSKKPRRGKHAGTVSKP